MVTPESSVVWKQSNVGVTVPVYTIREDPGAVTFGSGKRNHERNRDQRELTS